MTKTFFIKDNPSVIPPSGPERERTRPLWKTKTRLVPERINTGLTPVCMYVRLFDILSPNVARAVLWLSWSHLQVRTPADSRLSLAYRPWMIINAALLTEPGVYFHLWMKPFQDKIFFSFVISFIYLLLILPFSTFLENRTTMTCLLYETDRYVFRQKGIKIIKRDWSSKSWSELQKLICSSQATIH